MTVDMNKLSNDVLRLVFRHLSVPELGQCMVVCKKWKETLTEEEGADQDISVWRLKLEERWWRPSASHENYREQFHERLQYQRQFARELENGRFVKDCESRSWLLTGHDKRVHFIGQSGSFIITVAGNGQFQSWKLPFDNNRPRGQVVITANEIGRVDTTVQIDDSRIILGSFDGTVILVYFGTKHDDTAIEGRIVQRFQQHPRPVNSICASQSIVITACADNLIRAFSVSDDSSDNAPLETENEPLVVMRGHTRGVNQLRLGSRDSTVLSSSTDQTVRIWNYMTGECLRSLSFDCFGGGPSIFGCNRNEVALLWDTAEGEAILRVHRLADGREVRSLQTATSGRFYTADLHEQFILCGTKDGHLIEFDLLGGHRTCETEHSLGSTVTTVQYLGDRNTAYVIVYDGRLLLVRRQKCSSTSHHDTWVVVRTIALNMRASAFSYEPSCRTLLVASEGYLVRAFVFEG